MITFRTPCPVAQSTHWDTVTLAKFGTIYSFLLPAWRTVQARKPIEAT